MLQRHLPTNVLATFLARIANVALEFFCVLLLARILKASAYGSYAFTMSCLGLIAVPAAAGFDRLLIREVATLKSVGEWGLLRGLLRRSTLTVGLWSVSIALVVAFTATAMRSEYPHELHMALLTGTLLVPIIAYARVRQAILQGLGYTFAGQMPELLVQPATVILVATGTYLLVDWPRTGAEAIVIQALGAFSAALIGFLALRRRLPTNVRDHAPQYRTAYWIRSSVPFVWLLGMNMILVNVDTVMVGLLSGSADAGIYRVTGQMAALISLPLTAASIAAAPAIALLHMRGDREALQRRIVQATRISLAGAIPIAAGLMVLGTWLLKMFGSEFPSGYRSLLILSIGYMINAYAGIAGYLLIMTKFERTAAMAFLLAAVADIALNALLIPMWGIEGAAAATAMSLALLSMLMMVAARRLLGLRVTLSGRASSIESDV